MSWSNCILMTVRDDGTYCKLYNQHVLVEQVESKRQVKGVWVGSVKGLTLPSETEQGQPAS